VLHHGLRTLGDLKGDVDPRLMINNIGIDLDVLVTAILVERRDAGNALMEQLVAKLSPRQEQPMAFHRNLLNEIAFVDMLIAAEGDGLNLVARSAVHVVYEIHVGILILVVRGYFCVKVALALKEIDQISPAFFYQIGINRALGEYWDQLFHLPST